MKRSRTESHGYHKIFTNPFLKTAGETPHAAHPEAQKTHSMPAFLWSTQLTCHQLGGRLLETFYYPNNDCQIFRCRLFNAVKENSGILFLNQQTNWPSFGVKLTLWFVGFWKGSQEIIFCLVKAVVHREPISCSCVFKEISKIMLPFSHNIAVNCNSKNGTRIFFKIVDCLWIHSKDTGTSQV